MFESCSYHDGGQRIYNMDGSFCGSVTDAFLLHAHTLFGCVRFFLLRLLLLHLSLLYVFVFIHFFSSFSLPHSQNWLNSYVRIAHEGWMNLRARRRKCKHKTIYVKLMRDPLFTHDSHSYNAQRTATTTSTTEPSTALCNDQFHLLQLCMRMRRYFLSSVALSQRQTTNWRVTCNL